MKEKRSTKRLIAQMMIVVNMLDDYTIESDDRLVMSSQVKFPYLNY